MSTYLFSGADANGEPAFEPRDGERVSDTASTAEPATGEASSPTSPGLASPWTNSTRGD